MFDAKTMFNGMFGKVQPGKCRLAMNGKIAVQTNGDYKTYDVKTGRLVNCSNFAFDVGDDFFFVIPTNKVNAGDIILVNGKPRVVRAVKPDSIEVFNFETSAIESIVPERHVFMGNTYFYGKIVSLFGNSFGKKSGMGNIMKMMMMSEMFKGGKSGSSSFSDMMPMMMMMNGGNIFDDMFEGLFDEAGDFPALDFDGQDVEEDSEEA